jgi:uncharacterized protein (TIGR02145 family)
MRNLCCLAAVFVIFTGCKKDTKPGSILATINTTAISAITFDQATSGGNITCDGGAAVTERGICYNTAPTPTTANNKVVSGTGAGNFSTAITRLTASTTYYVRAYAINSAGTAYGAEIKFTTDFESITIGTQTWMKKNLEVTTYRNGDSIPQVTGATAWAGLSAGAWCYYNNDPANGTVYGKLYNWFTVNDPRNIAPAGWHVPSQTDWMVLIAFLGDNVVAGGKMKEQGTAHWNSPNAGATNSSGFTALPGAFRSYNGDFSALGNQGNWWSVTENLFNTPIAWFCPLNFDNGGVNLNSFNKPAGFSVRCIKD